MGLFMKNVGLWIWGVIALPINFCKLIQLLEENKKILTSPSEYNQLVQLYKTTLLKQIEVLGKEKDNLVSSDTQKSSEISTLIVKLEEALVENDKLLIQKDKLAGEKSIFQRGFARAEIQRRVLSKEIEQLKLKSSNVLGGKSLLSFAVGTPYSSGSKLSDIIFGSGSEKESK